MLIATDHTAFDYDMIVKHAPLVIDTRNATAAVHAKPRKDPQDVSLVAS